MSANKAEIERQTRNAFRRGAAAAGEHFSKQTNPYKMRVLRDAWLDGIRGARRHGGSARMYRPSTPHIGDGLAHKTYVTRHDNQRRTEASNKRGCMAAAWSAVRRLFGVRHGSR